MFFEAQHHGLLTGFQLPITNKPGELQELAGWADWLEPEKPYRKGLALSLKDDYKGALSFFEQTVVKDTGYAAAWKGIGFCKDKLGEYTEAGEECKQVIRLKPDEASAYFYNLGLIYLELGDKGAATAEYEILKTLDKDLARELSKKLK